MGRPPGWAAADFPVLLSALAPPQALFRMNTEIERDKGRPIKEAQHEVFKPPQRFPDHMIEDIRDVFKMPTDPSTGGVIDNEGRMGC